MHHTILLVVTVNKVVVVVVIKYDAISGGDTVRIFVCLSVCRGFEH